MADQKKMVEAITSMDEDFAKWYTDIVKKADLADYSSVRGCMIVRPYGCAIWENIQHILDTRFKELAMEKTGFIKSMWCGDEACELRVKEEAGLTSRCMPFEQEHIGDTCPICGKPAVTSIIWGKAY